MANQSTLRPELSSLLQQYLKLLRIAPKYSRVLTAAVFCTVLGGFYEKRRRAQKSADERQGQTLVRRNSAVKLTDGTRVIYVPYKQKTAKVTLKPTKGTTFDAHRRLFLEPPGGQNFKRAGAGGEAPPMNTKPGLNLAFLHQLLSLLSIMIPRLTSKESFLLLLHTIFLVTRTYLSLVVARLDGEIVRDLVAGNGKSFSWGIVKWLGVGGPAVYCNAMIKYLQAKISIAFRTRLTRYIHDLYLNDSLGYYKVQNLDGGLVGGGADQFITSDLPLFCDNAAALYSSLGKPFLDLCVFNYQLYRALGPLAFAGIMVNYIGSAWMLRKLSPPFGKLAATQGRREGELRGLHSRIIANAEEIAFYGGSDMERGFLDKGFKELKQLMERIYGMKIRYNMLEDFVLKYSWSAFGYLITSLPIFLPAWGGLGGLLELGAPSSGSGGREEDRMKAFITNKRLMLSLADAGGRMMYSIKDLSELAGYTSRVYSLISTLHRVHSHSYSSTRPELYSLTDIQGTLHTGFTGIRLEGVPIVAPVVWPRGGDEIVEEVDILIRPGDHLLISGPNGAGKSSIARLIAGLWPVYRGLVSRPRNISNAGLKGEPVTPDMGGVMFLPQKPYLAQGTLRDQVIYPHTEADMRAAGVSDHDLVAVLEAVRLSYLPSREGGWDTKKEWKDVLSGGEKQRISLARIVYHLPAFAVLDEPTSAVSSDVEGLLYEVCKAKGITLVTLSTRASLKKYHVFQLSLDGDGGWAMERIGGAEERGEVERELEILRERIRGTEEMRERLEHVKEELGRVWVQGGELPAQQQQHESEEDSDVSEELVVEDLSVDLERSEIAESFASFREHEVESHTATSESYAEIPPEMPVTEVREGESFADAVKMETSDSTTGSSSADETPAKMEESAAGSIMDESYVEETPVKMDESTAGSIMGESYVDAVKMEPSASSDGSEGSHEVTKVQGSIGSIMGESFAEVPDSTELKEGESYADAVKTAGPATSE
ncbi:ABC transporter transmembrane region 2-domain-containing protein [Tricharina praecox]|uniref:ABC transporter transmembrane region 2-domain-containing protein n=1 Tax=Tricharina praecox TaxID=43433 RepID=UPI00221FA4EE|nr:ABC transporter transmembrane region 2-domain-containing protein [Tricharina praecox]KAI5850952.1 ABC transporter transmembrane region 2-domain-containing protein [Tricharina praecox]